MPLLYGLDLVIEDTYHPNSSIYTKFNNGLDPGQIKNMLTVSSNHTKLDHH